MNRFYQAAGALLLATALAGCGGGGDSADASATPTPTPSPAPTPNVGGPAPGAAPTTALVDNATTATALADEAKVAIAAGQRRSQAPSGVSLFALPAGVATTVNCTAGGTFTVDYPATIAAGTTYSFTYTNCSPVAGATINGTYVITYASFVNSSNFSWSITYNLSYAGTTNYSYSGSQTCSYVSGVATCTFSDSGRTFESNFTYANGVLNGTYQWTYGNFGTVTYVFTNWGATSGTIQVTGANGTTATIVRNSATSYTITINGGTPRTVNG